MAHKKDVGASPILAGRHSFVSSPFSCGTSPVVGAGRDEPESSDCSDAKEEEEEDEAEEDVSASG